jgi:hypothetical protein
MRVCQQCGTPLPVYARSNVKTCSARCRVALHRAAKRSDWRFAIVFLEHMYPARWGPPPVRVVVRESDDFGFD